MTSLNPEVDSADGAVGAMAAKAPLPGMIARSLDRLGTSAPWFRARLADEGLVAHCDSELAQALAALEELRRVALSDDAVIRFSAPNGARNSFNFFSRAIGADFLTKALHWGHTSGLTIPRARWAHLASGHPILTMPGENTAERNWTWEVVLASLAATFATGVAFAEPDVTCEFEGRTFAIAAKVAYSNNKVVSNVANGLRQASGKACATLVFVDVVHLYPVFETFDWSSGKKFSSNDDAVAQLTSSVGRWCDDFGIQKFMRRARKHLSVPTGVAFFVPLLLQTGGLPASFLYTHMPVAWAGEDGPDFAFAKAFLHACSDVLSFSTREDAA